MTLDEAINRMKSSVEDGMNGIREPKSYIIHAEEYAQMVEFLEELKDWRKLKPVCAFDGYVIYKDRGEVSDISKIGGYCDTCKHNDGYPTSEVCQWCGAFHHYEKGEENEADN